MTKQGIKRAFARRGGFTLVELLIVVAIIAILSGAAYIGIMRSQSRVTNEKVLDDLVAIANALEQYKQDKGNYPNIADGSLTLGADKNISCFASDTTYSHDCEDTLRTAFIQTQVDNILLTKRYLQEVPTDPRTKSRYIYGVTADGRFFQVAGNYETDEGVWVAKVRGNVEKGFHLPSLIRAFDGRNFVMEGESYLPYSPDHLTLTARLEIEKGTVKVNGQSASNGDTIQPGSEVRTEADSGAILYFSDGSVTYLESNTQLKVLSDTKVQKNDKDGIITKIRLKLLQGKIWSKVARLASESEFNVETTSAIAGVRGTEFGISATGNELIVLSGSVVARQLASTESISADAAFSFSSLPTTNDFGTNQVAHNLNGTDFQKFLIPTKEQNYMPTGSIADAEKTAILEKFYSGGAFNNNYRPRILEIDTDTPAKIVFEYIDNVEMINALPSDYPNAIAAWTSSLITADPVAQTLTVIPDMTSVFNPGMLTRFNFQDKSGNITGFSDPSVFIGPGVLLTEADIYNIDTEVVQAPTGPSILSTPTSVALSTQHSIQSDQPCDWSIQGGGQLIAPYLGTSTVTYKTIDDLQTVDWRITEVQSRFTGTPSDSVAIKCTDLNDPTLFDQKTIVINYEPWKVSNVGANYEYSWFAKGSTDWASAGVACTNLTEGGHTDWKLPTKAEYEQLNTMQRLAEGALWCGIWDNPGDADNDSNLNECTDMPDGVASIWLEEEQSTNNAYSIVGNNLNTIGYSEKSNAGPSNGFRCVR